MSTSPPADIGRLQRRVDRERSARIQAETIAERMMTDLSTAVQELACSRQVLDETTDLVMITDPAGYASYVNRAFCEVLRIDSTDPPDGLELIGYLAPASRIVWSVDVLAALEEKGSWRGELDLSLPGGDDLPVSLVAIAHTSRDGIVDSISCIARDISEQRALHQQLAHLAHHDPLTGLANRRRFYDYVNAALDRNAHADSGAIAVLFIDVDDFKQVNDTFGHQTGDDVLVAVADRLRASVRSADAVCRFGGDEFGVLCDTLRDDHDAKDVAERVLASLDVPITVGECDLSVSVSIGVAVGAGDSVDTPELVRAADRAMYEAKRNGKRRYTVAPAMAAAPV